jgi:hypothetical protein
VVIHFSGLEGLPSEMVNGSSVTIQQNLLTLLGARLSLLPAQQALRLMLPKNCSNKPS